MYKRLILTGTVAAVLGLATTGSARAAVDWHACPQQKGFECASLDVPMDYDSPGGRVTLALIRHRAHDRAARRGSLFINAGGPGGATTSAAAQFTRGFPAAVRAHFDIVGFDPRGIGASDQLRCFDSYGKESALLGELPAGGIPIGPEEAATTADVYARFAAACAADAGPLQDHMSTANVARDMDRIRAALDEPKLNYYGPSYGTYLGATYLNMFPGRAGRVIPDGNVPPVQWNDAQAGATTDTFTRIGSPAGNEEALRTMLRQCGRVDRRRCAFSTGTPQATLAKYRTLIVRLGQGPVEVNGLPHTLGLAVSRIGSGLSIQAEGAGAPGWKGTARLMQAFWRATQAPDRKVADPGAPKVSTPEVPKGGFPLGLPEGTDGVLCGESPNPADPAAFAEAGASWPLAVGAAWPWLAAPCARWTARDADRYTGPWDRSTIAPLLVGTLHDPNTNYRGTLRMARQLGRGRVLTEAGGGHTALLNPSRCVGRRITDYLLDGRLPDKGTVCPQDTPAF